MNEKLVKIDERTYSFEDGFVRCFLLIGTKKALWIDSGVSGADLITIARELTDLPLELLNTHGDGDHMASNGLFESFYMSQADYEGCGVQAKLPNSNVHFFNDGDQLDLGDYPLEMILIPGHTKGSIAILDKVNKRLYAGDSVGKEHIFLFGQHRAPELFSLALEKLISYQNDYDTVYASHGVMALPKDAVQKVLEAYKEVESGNVEGHIISLHGSEVNSFDLEFCGFYLGK